MSSGEWIFKLSGQVAGITLFMKYISQLTNSMLIAGYPLLSLYFLNCKYSKGREVIW